MLKLKKLQILGFKSFCDRTDLRFQGEGIAAIVGPNGCGKSNISDAISWVLGEQSARLLRGVHMQDVIFAGTRERKPTGMAEVSLTLVDPEVYGDVAEPEIDIQDECVHRRWDESAVRAARAEDVERYSEEVRPGLSDDEALAADASPSLCGRGAFRRCHSSCDWLAEGMPASSFAPTLHAMEQRSSSKSAAVNLSAPSRPARSRLRGASFAPAKANTC